MSNKIIKNIIYLLGSRVHGILDFNYSLVLKYCTLNLELTVLKMTIGSAVLVSILVWIG